MKVIMTGGGTGGHIYPAIAIADKIKKEQPDAEILFVGTRKGLEKDLVPQNGYPIEFITVSGFYRKKLLKNVKTMRDLAKGNKEAKADMSADRWCAQLRKGEFRHIFMNKTHFPVLQIECLKSM